MDMLQITRLDDIDLSGCHLDDVKMSFLFKNLTRAKSLSKLELAGNEFGIVGIQSMVPFLKRAQNISMLEISDNQNINTECFNLLVEALQIGGTIKILWLESCNIDDITALEQYFLPRLRELGLCSNNIQRFPSLENYTNLEELWLQESTVGIEGCRSIAKLLQKDGSNMEHLHLDSTDIGVMRLKCLPNL